LQFIYIDIIKSSDLLTPNDFRFSALIAADPHKYDYAYMQKRMGVSKAFPIDEIIWLKILRKEVFTSDKILDSWA